MGRCVLYRGGGKYRLTEGPAKPKQPPRVHCKAEPDKVSHDPHIRRR